MKAPQGALENIFKMKTKPFSLPKRLMYTPTERFDAKEQTHVDHQPPLQTLRRPGHVHWPRGDRDPLLAVTGLFD